jgi:hypothetical protein
VRLALAGDAMLGRGVAEALSSLRRALFAAEIVETRAADVCVLNLNAASPSGATRGRPEPSTFGPRPPRPRRSPISASIA